MLLHKTNLPFQFCRFPDVSSIKESYPSPLGISQSGISSWSVITFADNKRRLDSAIAI